MFRGINAISLDNKGRMVMPTRYRARLQALANNQLILTIDTEDKCLLLYPLSEWELIEQKLAALPSLNPQSRRVQRLLIGHATEIELDNNGRLLLPTLLREFAELKKDIMLVGQGKRFEVWSEANWREGCSNWLGSPATDTSNLPEELQVLNL